jgi:hypothetical protein
VWFAAKVVAAEREDLTASSWVRGSRAPNASSFGDEYRIDVILGEK